nr:hypothetical protein [Tanacetum cinerariifolium]
MNKNKNNKDNKDDQECLVQNNNEYMGQVNNECLGENNEQMEGCDDNVESQLDGNEDVVDCGIGNGLGNECPEKICDLVRASNSHDFVSTLMSDKHNENTDGMSNMNESNKNVQKEKCNGNESKNDFAKVVNNLNELYSNKLDFMLPDLDKDGVTIVNFENDLVKEGCRKWVNTVCGYFMWTKMALVEVKYNVKRMWGRGLDKIAMNGYFYSNLGMKKGYGISTIASSLGRPIIMDEMTTKMCHQGAEKCGSARVLVEVNAMQGCQ